MTDHDASRTDETDRETDDAGHETGETDHDADATEQTACEQCGREVPVAVYVEHLLKECPGGGD